MSYAVRDTLRAVLSHTLFDPVITGAALYALTLGGPTFRAYLPDLSHLPLGITEAHVVTALKVLVGVGAVGRVSGWLDWFSQRNWELVYSGKPWVWDEEVVVITGGSGGIATSIVEKLIPKGLKIALLDLSPPRSDIAKSPNVRFYKCDITSSKAIHEAAEQIRRDLGKPTVLVNNAGLGIGSSIIDETDAQIDLIFRVNIISQWYTVREFLPDMIKGRKGHVVTVASMASYTSMAGSVDYSATKAGALAFHEGLTQEIRHIYKAPWIRTTCGHPFWTKTALTAPIESGITKTDVLMTPEYVGGIFADAILSGKGSHLIIPASEPKLRAATLLRGMPTWINSMANDTTKQSVLTAIADGVKPTGAAVDAVIGNVKDAITNGNGHKK